MLMHTSRAKSRLEHDAEGLLETETFRCAGMLFHASPVTPSAATFQKEVIAYRELTSRIRERLQRERIDFQLKALADRLSAIESALAKEIKRQEDVVKPAESPFDWECADSERADTSEIQSVLFRASDAFEADVAGLPSRTRKLVVSAINANAMLLLKDRAKASEAFKRSCSVLLHGGLNSSLRELNVGRTLRVILAIDDDPIFGQVIVTLLRVVSESDKHQAYEGLIELLYSEQVLDVRTSES